MASSAHGSSSWDHRKLSIAAGSNAFRPGPPDHVQAGVTEQPIRVLLVSDLLLHRAGVRHVLDTTGIVLVGEAGTCDEAVAAAARERPDIILIDLDLCSDAFRCVGAIVSAVPGSRIIALSDRARAADHHTLVELGATGLVL